MITVLRWLLLPFSFLYQAIIWLRNRMYDFGLLKSRSFTIPTIVIGNLAVGGAGKSPITEYLIRLLKSKYKVATLSRGYGRKTKGFRFVEPNSIALEVGDEPLQFKRKFEDITVAVCEDRCTGVEHLSVGNDLILLDDAYQHRKLNAGLYILLFDFNSLFKPLLTLPTGNFRDNFSSTKRADSIVITKCPEEISEAEKTHIEKLIKKYSTAPIFFSKIVYSKPRSFQNQKQQIDTLLGYDIILFCGIANPNPLIEYLQQENTVKLIQFPDHHNYNTTNFDKVIQAYDSLSSTKKIIVTTEKDTQRIDSAVFCDYPLYYIPIEVNIGEHNNQTLDYYVEYYLSKASSVKES